MNMTLSTRIILIVLFLAVAGCRNQTDSTTPVLTWYVFDEPSGAFSQAARSCSESSGGAYSINIALLPADADQQREQLVRRLAAGDSSIDIIGMDVIWTAEFAEAGWIRPWPLESVSRIAQGRLEASVQSATYKNRLQAVPFTTNTQLLWYRTDRVPHPPATWKEMLHMAESLGDQGTIQAQGERYEGLTVFFTSLLASAGGTILKEEAEEVSMKTEPMRQTLNIMQTLANSPASDPSLSTSREDQARLAFETGDSTFMINYTFVWPSAHRNAPEVAKHMGWARWPAVEKGGQSRVTIGGINLAVGAYSRYPQYAFPAAECIASEQNKHMAAERGGLPPTITHLYNDPAVRNTFPFADTLLATLETAVQRPRTPLYNDISLAISRTLHPMEKIDPEFDIARLRKMVIRALQSEGLL